MSKNLSRLALTLISLGLVLWLAFADLSKTNPGEISAAHASISTLLGGPTCSKCHGEKAEDLPAACLDCHQEVQSDIQNKHGLHGTLVAPGAMECSLCHSEHHGSAFALVSENSFSLAGVEDLAAFDHVMFDFQLEGKHLTIACQKCHELAEIAVLEEGQRRYMGLSQDCVTCHEDPHKGKMKEDCASCHGQSEAFDLVATFAHDERFPLRGVHDEIGCVECHAKDDLYSVESIGGINPPQWRACADCHESPHAENFLATNYQRFPQEEQNCAACHLLEHTDFVAARAYCTAAEHEASGFALIAPHDQLSCDQCHAAPPQDRSAQATLATYAARFPGRSAEDCAACHKDPHAGQFQNGDLAAENCLSCHDPLQFQPAKFDNARHAETGFVLDGAHAATDCALCHVDENLDDELGPVYAAVDSKCQSCHLDAHDACFEEFALVSDRSSLDCNRCHDTTSFQQVLAPGFDHGVWTAFQLEGKHARNDCETCHQPLPAPTAAGRSFGTATALLERNQDSCDSCHEDVHLESFDRPGLPLSVAGRESCARCHGQEQFLPVPAASFDHALWASHELRGAHVRAECASCHTPESRALGKARPPLGKECAACHADPHDQRFDALNLPASVNGNNSCARCHNEESFEDMRGAPFDHEAWTDFALVDAHRFADCAACHGRSNAVASAPATRSLGKVADLFPGSTNRCETCHTNPHGDSFRVAGVPNNLNGKEGCVRCHSQVSFRVAENNFDHDRMTSFDLQGAHTNVDCSKCHRPLQRRGRDARSFDRALGTTCADCHADPHVGQFRNSKNDQCQDCHADQGTFPSGLLFRHKTHSSYQLDGAHDDLACASCHVAYPLANGRTVVRYRPLGTECSDCHGLR